jgi:hypothetical protein
MSRLAIHNMTQEFASDCSWTAEFVELSSGDLYLDGQPFGTYFAACYPESDRLPQFIINAVDADGCPISSVPFEYRFESSEPVRPIPAISSPWDTDGVLVGSIPTEAERSVYSRAAEVLAVAKELVLIEPNLVSPRREA